MPCRSRLEPEPADRSQSMTRKVLKNAAIGATASSAGVLLFFAIRHVAIDVPYVWSWAILAATCYRYVAVRFSIYGKAFDTRHKWKNGLLGVPIVAGIQVVSLITKPLVNAPVETPIAICLATLLCMAVSDALA